MPRNKYPEETVEKILDSAFKLFIEKGYEQTTVLDIVAGMGGLTRGAFYHHFKSKEDVLDAVGDKLFFDNNPFEKVKLQKGLTGLEKLKTLIMDSVESTDKRKIDIMSIRILNSPVFLCKLVENNKMIAPMYQELIEEGVKDGSIKTPNPKLLAELIPILTNFWMVPTIYPTTTLEDGIERFLYIKEILENLGLHLFDEKVVEMVLASVEDIYE